MPPAKAFMPGPFLDDPAAAGSVFGNSNGVDFNQQIRPN
jgi:hypothetical protein